MLEPGGLRGGGVATAATVNVPNALTMARVLLAPVLALTLQTQDPAGAAFAVFALGMATDVLDGHFARSRGLDTGFGKLMDPLADKLFVGTAFVCLAAGGLIAVWVVSIVFARELFVTALRLVARREGTIIAASQLGKAKTVVQTVVVLVLIAAGPAGVAVQALVYAMVAITVVSGLDYANAYARGHRLPGRGEAESLRLAA